MCKVLLPIKPKYARQILNGSKTFEYRKNRFRRNDVDTIVIYATSPIKKVLGEAKLIDVLEATPKNIWDKTSYSGGIDKKNFDKYFEGRSKAFAYALGEVKVYKTEKSLKEFNINYYPQSFVYIDKENQKY